jgi:hypothetical protein
MDGEPGMPHQPVKLRGIYKAACEPFESSWPLADYYDSRTVGEHQAVVIVQKIASQPRKEEMAERFLVNVHDAGKIAGSGFANYTSAIDFG